VILQFDWSVGEIVAALSRLHLADNTLLIVTSDNGPVVDDGYQDQAIQKLDGHRPAGPLRGGKYSAFEGGTRIPFILRWPGHVKADVSDALVCQIDFLASFAKLAGLKLNAGEARDSMDMLSAFLGESKKGRSELVEHAGALALRKGQQKYIEPRKGPKFLPATRTETGNDPDGLMFELGSDLGETNNLARTNSESMKELGHELQKIRTGRD